MRPDLPGNESERLAALAECAVLDTPPERAFDDLTRLASEICETPIALIPLVAETRQWFKSRIGVDVPSTPRDISFCAHAILSDEPLIVGDAARDPRFRDNPLVVGPPHARAYAGVPLTTRDGYRLGTLCVIDTRPRSFSARQIASLRALASQASNQLELRRTLRAMERTELELHRALRAANEANEVKTRFLASLSAELRTPLNDILGAVGLLRRTALSDKQQRCARLASTSSLSLLALVNNAIDLCRLEAGDLRLDAIPFEPRRLLDDIADQVRGAAERASVGFQVAPDSGDPTTLVGDPTRLRQILVTLCERAIDLADTGMIELRASVCECTPASCVIRFDVVDPASRIQDARLASVTRALEPGAISAADRVERAGLALTLASRLAERMGATIESRPARCPSAAFSISVPLHRHAAPPQPAHEPGRRAESRRRAVLAISDPLSRVIALELLRSTGVETTLAATSQEALRLAGEADTRLLVLDDHPSPAEALSLCRDARNLRRLTPQGSPPPLRILMLTRSGSTAPERDALAAVVDETAPLPVEPDDLLDRAHRLLREQPGVRPAQSAA